MQKYTNEFDFDLLYTSEKKRAIIEIENTQFQYQ